MKVAFFFLLNGAQSFAAEHSRYAHAQHCARQSFRFPGIPYQIRGTYPSNNHLAIRKSLKGMVRAIL